MVVKRLLRRLASAAPAPVFALAGRGGRRHLQDLRLHADHVLLLDSPRSANILLVVGPLPGDLLNAALHAHDALSLPRACAWCPIGSLQPELLAALPGIETVERREDLPSVLPRLNRDLLTGARRSDGAVLPDDPPAPWRGVGPYGQGGSGMTGGVPYGRPMAERADDRDGLMLDQLPVAVGPFFQPFPPGLTLNVKFQGDVVQVAEPGPNPFQDEGLPRHPDGPFLRVFREPVAIAELELARARAHLRWLSDALRVHGLGSLAIRALRLAQETSRPDATAIARMRAALRLAQVTGWATRGIGRAPAADLRGLGLGPVARASGLEEDLRAEEPEYRALGFRTIVGRAGDAAARYEQRLAEVAQAMDIASRAGSATIGPVGQVEAPRGRVEPGSHPTSRLLPLLPALLAGQAWDDAVTTVVSLDLDLDEAAAAPEPSAEESAA